MSQSFEGLLPGCGGHSGLDGAVVDALGLNTPTITYVHPDVARLPERPADHGLVQMVNAYPLHGCVMVVVAATDAPGVPADEPEQSVQRWPMYLAALTL